MFYFIRIFLFWSSMVFVWRERVDYFLYLITFLIFLSSYLCNSAGLRSDGLWLTSISVDAQFWRVYNSILINIV